MGEHRPFSPSCAVVVRIPKSCPCTLATCSMSSRQRLRFWSHEFVCKAKIADINAISLLWDPLQVDKGPPFTWGLPGSGKLPGQRLLCVYQNVFLFPPGHTARTLSQLPQQFVQPCNWVPVHEMGSDVCHFQIWPRIKLEWFSSFSLFSQLPAKGRRPSSGPQGPKGWWSH